jgi:2-polyprenyl-6-methoxyphenol hydroxylase-like FAD-dependent oxidoreductase
LQLLLLEAARVRIGSQRIHTNHHLAAFDQDAARVTAHFTDRHTGDPVGSHRADLLVGADGIHSTVRKAFYPDEGTPKWAGQLVWRGVTRAEPCFNGKTMIVAGDHRRRIVAYPIEPLPGADGLTSINWVAEETFDDQAMPPREDWNRERPTADILPYFSNWKFDWLDVPVLLAGAPAAYEFPKVDRDPIERWSFGRVTLLGDAAHPMMPHGGNGASQAILDAAALVEALAGNEDAEGGLVAYQASRLPQVSELVRVNREMLGPALVLRLADERAPNGFASVYDVISKEELETISRSYAQLTGLGQASE